jgi:DNA-binding NarL/FixJ family response regulator
MTAKKKTILVVDDSPVILERLVIKLQQLDNAGAILPAQTFEDALGLLRATSIDIAVFDIHLQDKSGIDLLRIVGNEYPGIVVIILTNQANDQIEMACKQLGAKHFLDKSKDFAQVPRIIAAIV